MKSLNNIIDTTSQKSLAVKIKKAAVRQVFLQSLVTFLILLFAIFIGLTQFSASFFEGILKGQHNAIVQQRWREVGNGILFSWPGPRISEMCVYDEGVSVFALGECKGKSSYLKLKGSGHKVAYQNFEFEFYFSQNLWIMAALLDMALALLIFIVFIAFREKFTQSNRVAIAQEIFDISKREETASQKISDFEDLIRDQAKNLTALREKAAIAGIARQVAHDIRSPLTAINTVAGLLGDVESEKIKLLRMATGRLNKIADDLLIKSKRNSSEEEGLALLGYEFFALKKIIEETVELKRLEVGSHVEFIFESDSNISGRYLLDGSVFSRIVSNLINNSVEAIEDKGRVFLSLAKRGQELIFTIKDSGKGVPEEMILKIFEPGVSFEKEKGNGLGLSSAKKEVEAWGGAIEFKSFVGKGSELTISLRSIT